MKRKLSVFVQHFPQSVPFTLILLPTRMKKVDCFKCGADEALVFIPEMLSDCAYTWAKVILEFFLVPSKVKQPSIAKNCPEISTLVHNGRRRIAISDIHYPLVGLRYRFLVLLGNFGQVESRQETKRRFGSQSYNHVLVDGHLCLQNPPKRVPADTVDGELLPFPSFRPIQKPSAMYKNTHFLSNPSISSSYSKI
ncbi:hypothetical protein [Burkholderia sp. Bp9143]|uniref:hypothetical protein n=1 Tax=Burkholderia sp. Bp9143 TaxID=2184574 RepID=UPI0016247C27|nr:hypothetical protein [Burkholderia sp. Bp9143]